MTTDLRVERRSFYVNTGKPTTLSSTLPDELDGTVVSWWVGGDPADTDDLSDATEAEGTTTDGTTQWVIPAVTTRTLIRLTVDEVPVTVGWLYPSNLGTEDLDLTVPITVGASQFDVTVAGRPGTPGVGVPDGGTAGQVLAKASDDDHDTEWTTPTGGGTSDHGALTGLNDDDHTQYALADGSRGQFATTTQGGKADTATQPADLAAAIGALGASDVGADPAGSAATVAASLASHTGDTTNPHEVTKALVGLGSVDNTSDANKPVSTATQTALDGKANTGHTHSGLTTTTVKASDSSITSTTTLTDVTGLDITATNGTTYRFRYLLFLTGTSAADVWLALSAPAGTLLALMSGPANAASSAPANTVGQVVTGSTDVRFGTITGATVGVVIEGTFTASASGTVRPQFRQHSSDATPTVVLAGSTLTLF